MLLKGGGIKYFVVGTKHGQEGYSQILAVSPFLTLLGLEAGCCEREEEFLQTVVWLKLWKLMHGSGVCLAVSCTEFWKIKLCN